MLPYKLNWIPLAQNQDLKWGLEMSGLQLYRDEIAQPGIDSNDSNRYSETATPKEVPKEEAMCVLEITLVAWFTVIYYKNCCKKPW